MSQIKEVTDDTFDSDVLKSDKTVVVDFWAPWCMPCRMMSPILDEVSGKNDTVVFCKLNTDDNRKTPSKYNVMGIPSLIFFKNGQEVHRVVGVQPAASLQTQLDKFK